MGGGLMQLVAYGAQDIYLTGNPQITFFKVVYRRHTNFSIEAIQQTFEESTDNLFSGGKKSLLISRNGDLVYKMWLECLLNFNASSILNNSTYVNWTNNTGHALIEECSIKIGGQQMDKHSSRWLDIWNELTDHEESDWLGLNKHSAKNAYLKSNNNTNLYSDRKLKLYIPLQFWFNRNVGLALPLIALQYHEVELDIKFRGISALINTDQEIGTILPTSSNSTLNVKVFADYIYLDTDERRRFAQVSHEYLIEQVQQQSFTGSTSALTLKLNFNHPVKELIWAIINATEGWGHADTDGGSFKALDDQESSTVINADATWQLKLNGHDRFEKQPVTYFTRYQPYKYHTSSSRGAHIDGTGDSIGVYSFALKPEEHQPSGTCNFSRIDNAQLITSGAQTGILNIYAVNYNVLRIMSGMGGLAYSN